MKNRCLAFLFLRRQPHPLSANFRLHCSMEVYITNLLAFININIALSLPKKNLLKIDTNCHKITRDEKAITLCIVKSLTTTVQRNTTLRFPQAIIAVNLANTPPSTIKRWHISIIKRIKFPQTFLRSDESLESKKL